VLHGTVDTDISIWMNTEANSELCYITVVGIHLVIDRPTHSFSKDNTTSWSNSENRPTFSRSEDSDSVVSRPIASNIVRRPILSSILKIMELAWGRVLLFQSCIRATGPVRPLVKLGSCLGPPIFRGANFAQ